ncbi:MAG: glycosyltransferase family 2 protein [Candidatus Omnitrophica bacterium]|nr:glycosyltransferase family 2 protein [Candidatus Omnitrophota bacterium]
MENELLKKNEKISIVVPIYNEEQAIVEVMDGLKSTCGDSEIIIVNDGSTDKTIDKISNYNFKVITHIANKGYGSALKTGIKNASNDVIVTIDADGSYPIDSIRILVENLGSYGMTVGKRVSKTKVQLWKKIGKYILWRISNFVTGLNIPDINSGLRVFRKSMIIEYLDLLPDSFSFSTTSTIIFLFNNYKIKYIPIQLYERKGKSKVSLYSGISSIKKIFLVTLFFKPVRAIILIFYQLATISLLIFCIRNLLYTAENSELGIFICLAIILTLFIIDLTTKCDKKLISDISV